MEGEGNRVSSFDQAPEVATVASHFFEAGIADVWNLNLAHVGRTFRSMAADRLPRSQR